MIEKWDGNIYLPKLIKLDPATDRYKMLKARIKQYELEAVLQTIDNIAQSNFIQGKMSGKNGRPFHLTFDWFVRPNNFPKILEGNYSGQISSVQIIYQGEGCQVETTDSMSSAFDRLRDKRGGM